MSKEMQFSYVGKTLEIGGIFKRVEAPLKINKMYPRSEA